MLSTIDSVSGTPQPDMVVTTAPAALIKYLQQTLRFGENRGAFARFLVKEHI